MNLLYYIYRIQNLKKLERLSIAGNNFTSLPYPASLSPKILRLTQLNVLVVHDCNALRTPLLKVCERGVDAVRKYYKDLACKFSVAIF